jgi:hypothetical protein
MSARVRVVFSVELLELILLHLTTRDILRCQGVNRYFQCVITSSPQIRNQIVKSQIELLWKFNLAAR